MSFTLDNRMRGDDPLFDDIADAVDGTGEFANKITYVQFEQDWYAVVESHAPGSYSSVIQIFYVEPERYDELEALHDQATEVFTW